MTFNFHAKWVKLVGQSYEGEVTGHFLKVILAIKMGIGEEKIKEFFVIC